jgi:hypothetical protein
MSAMGFRAQLNGVSLWDLVQMECLARSRRVVKVVGEGGVGYLFLADGGVIHAATARNAGEAAALEILSWTNGSFLTVERAWPTAPTITTSCEALILRVAKRRDEKNASNLVAFPARAAAESTAVEEALSEIADIQVTEIQQEGAQMRKTIIEEPPPGGTETGVRSEGDVDYSVMIRLGPNGAVIKNHGGSEELAEALAYTNRLVQLVGELLGLDAFTAMECTFGAGRWITFVDKNGELVALRPTADASLQVLRGRLGL